MIQSRVAQGRSVEDAVAEFSAAREAPNAIESHLRSWLAFMRHQVDAGQRSPNYLHPLRSYTRPGGPFSYWDGRLLDDVTFARLEDWAMWLTEQELAPKSVRNVLGAFRSFLEWCKRRGALHAMPEFPTVEVDESAPPIISAPTLDAILRPSPTTAAASS